MKILIPFLFLLSVTNAQVGLPFPGPGAPHSAGSGTGSLVGTPVTCAGAEPQACSYTVNASSNLLNVCLGNSAGDTVSVDATGYTFTAVSVLISGNTWNLRCFTAPTIASGAITVNCHGQFGDVVRCYIAEFHDTASFGGIDTSNIGTGASGTAMATAAFVTTVTDIVVGFGCNSNGTATVGAGFTSAIADIRCMLEYQLNVTAGSKTATQTAPASTTWLIQGYGIKL